MRFTKKLNYNLKRILPIGLIAATGMMSSCSDKEDEPPMPQHDVELVFKQQTSDATLTIERLQGLIADPSVRYIYMSVDGTWTNFTSLNIHESRHNFFQPRIEMSPKIRGRGNFVFKSGVPSQVPEDSLWFVQNGWTINQHLQKQK